MLRPIVPVLLIILSGALNALEFKSIDISINTVKLKVELALNSAQRRQGLMHRDNISEGQGMLFVFRKSRQATFWMKNTSIPLSIAFIDETGKIISIKQMNPLSLEGIESDGICRYALEVPQGWFKKNNIRKGDIVNIPARLPEEVK